MMINTIILMLLMTCFIALLVPLVIILLNIAKEMRRKNDIDENKVKIEQNKVYMDIDPIKAKELIDERIKRYISKWILVNITSQSGTYIKDSEVDLLINHVTAEFISDMSDVYLFYVKCLANIPNDQALIHFVRNETKFLVLEIVTEFNRTE